MTAVKQNAPSSPVGDAGEESAPPSPKSLDHDFDSAPPSPMHLDLGSDSDTASSADSDQSTNIGSPTEASDELSDDDYLPPRTKATSTQLSAPYALRLGDTALPVQQTLTVQRQGLTAATGMSPAQHQHSTLEIEPSPFPDTFTRGHLRAMNFTQMQREYELAAFVDLEDRVGAMYIGSPAQTLEWQRAVIQGGHDMLQAFECIQIDRAPSAPPPESIAAGIQCRGLRGGRPQNVQGPVVSMEHVAVALLRSSPTIQTIASFQNSALRQVAPRAWSGANQAIEAVLEHDLDLRLPFDIPNQRPHQPTAFSRVEYRFATKGFPSQERDSVEGGLCALTALGNYPPNEGELILWEDQTVLNFPCGSTFLLPKWMHYSFTDVEWPGRQMVLIQACDGLLGDYVSNDFYVPICGEVPTDEATLKQKADAATAKYCTRAEYDALVQVDSN
ncbi:hypothetical protein C8F04DRAFT_1274144 [Mycena alexandri]|uniref:Uncharacterized protein n=1 Tax=Mycena alexandri TaxID=1745969 RepID=A0AAD6S582_9AGAR|nr:hypothetical protein C8F04DRAFT_1274144 [Mycena alexandri]